MSIQEQVGPPTPEATRRIKRGIVTFLLLTFAISTPFYIITIKTEEVALPLLFSPAIAALITRYIYDRNLRGLGWRWTSTRYAVLAYFLPFFVSGAMFILAWLALDAYSTENTETGVVAGFASAAIVVALFLAIIAIGEEVGWRGYLVPELAKITSFRNVALISGVFWAVWHWPLIFFAADVTDFDTTPVWFMVPSFSVTIIAASVVLAWLTLRTGSLWPAVILHGSQNAITQEFFSTYTKDTGNIAYYVSEVGILITAAWLVAAFFFWRRRGELTTEPVPEAPPVP